MTDEDDHRQKMQRIKEVKDELYEQADTEKALLIVHTGTGKGKTTAAMGMVLRCLGHGMPVGIVQYVKGTRDTAETALLQEHFSDRVDLYRMGEGFTWETQDRKRDRRAAEAAWEQSRDMMASGGYRFLLLDELNIVLSDDLLDVDDVVSTLENRDPNLHVAVTGRRAPTALKQAADLVTEMKLIKHPFKEQGVKAQPGIEY